MTLEGLNREMVWALTPMYGRGEAEAIMREIWMWQKGWNLTDLAVRRDESLSPFIEGEVRKALARLLKWEPVQYITGKAPFFGLELTVKPGVLIPRPETAELVQIIVDEWNGKSDLCVLDACTGSGAIAVALARNLPFSRITAVDINPVALEVARDNARKLRVDVDVKHQDVLDVADYGGRYDIIVSNPPYVDEREKAEMKPNVLQYEPADALFVPDSNPLLFYEAICNAATRSLADGGMIYFEINPLHVSSMVEMLRGKGFEDVEALRDSQGNYRFVKGVWHNGRK